MSKTFYVRDVDDEVAAALEAAAEAHNMSLNQFLQGEFARLAREVSPRITLDLRHPQAARFVWNGARLDTLKLRGPDGATATLNAYGGGGGQKMTQELAEAKARAGEYISKARVLGNEEVGVDIVALLESAGWEVFPG
jgi:hypothetical protein